MQADWKLGIVIFTGAIVALGSWQYWPAEEAPPPEFTQVRLVQVSQAPEVPSSTQHTALADLDEKPSAAAAPRPSPLLQVAQPKKKPMGPDHAPASALLAKTIQALHQEAYERFINQPGMGMSRMVPTLKVMPREWKIPEWTSEELAKEQAPEGGAKDLSKIHNESVATFAAFNAKTPMERIALPNPNRLTKSSSWEIKSLDLVGLVMNDAPVVYVSTGLPDMKNLGKAPTRTLDVFESEGLEQLYEGKELYVRAKNGTIRVLGPIHAGKACLKCHHDAKEGDLLGAFSYTLRHAEYRLTHGNGQPTNPGYFYKNNSTQLPVIP